MNLLTLLAILLATKRILIILGSTIGGLLLLYLIFLSFELLKFQRRIKKKVVSLSTNLMEERRILLELDTFLKKSVSKINKETNASFQDVLKISISKIPAKNIASTNQKLNRYKKNALSYLEDSKFKKNQDLQRILTFIEEIEAERRTQIARYNTDADAFNYWVRSLTFRWLFFILRIKKKIRL